MLQVRSTVNKEEEIAGLLEGGGLQTMPPKMIFFMHHAIHITKFEDYGFLVHFLFLEVLCLLH